jgi:hypothetical protein
MIGESEDKMGDLFLEMCEGDRELCIEFSDLFTSGKMSSLHQENCIVYVRWGV